jgi:DNA-binding transcriptional MerR regulator
MQVLLEAHDAGRALEVSTARIRQLVAQGRLVPAARTRRGVRLFRAADVEALRRARERDRREARPEAAGKNATFR